MTSALYHVVWPSEIVSAVFLGTGSFGFAPFGAQPAVFFGFGPFGFTPNPLGFGFRPFGLTPDPLGFGSDDEGSLGSVPGDCESLGSVPSGRGSSPSSSATSSG